MTYKNLFWNFNGKENEIKKKSYQQQQQHTTLIMDNLYGLAVFVFYIRNMYVDVCLYVPNLPSLITRFVH